MVFFIILAYLFTFPLIVNFISTIYDFSQYRGDPLSTIWWMWWYSHAWHSGAGAGFVPLLNYPFGVNWSARPIAYLLDYPAAGLNFLINNEILTYNLIILTGLVLTAFFMFLLARYLTKSNIASVLAGVIFAFCPNQLMHSAQHMGFSVLFWAPLFILCLFRLKENISLLNAILCVLSGAVVFFVFSMKPIFQIGGLKIPNFSWFAYKILPMFRIYARMGVLVILSVAVLARLKLITGGKSISKAKGENNNEAENI